MFYFIPANSKDGKPFPKDAGCYRYHEPRGAVDTTFVQFYPTLVKVAKEKGTFKNTEAP